MQEDLVNYYLVTGYSIIHKELQIKKSLIDGKGIFIRVPVPVGTVMFDIVAEKIHYHNNQSMANQNPNWIGCGFEEWLKIGPGDIASYINHSCLPNVIINEKQEVIALVDLAAGEELFLDYSTTELDPYWTMNCNCGVPTCRNILRSFQYLPKFLQEKYAPFLDSSFVQTALLLPV